MALDKEAKLHKRVLKAITSDAFSDLIVDEAGLDKERSGEANSFPRFSIDHLSRRAALAAGKKVLADFTLLSPLVSDRNISITPKEVLRPDIVCINPETESIVIFELKKAKQTGREALTELLAYEHEIKNHLPLLSNYDVSFVLISTEWSPLMDHAVSAAIAWSGKNILCLAASEEKRKLVLKTRIPTAWRITGSVFFPEDAMASVTVCLYDKDAYSKDWSKSKPHSEEERLEVITRSAMNIIAREGERIGGHGFALLWKDHSPISLTRYNITVCGLAPFSFYNSVRKSERLNSGEGALVENLDDYIKDFDPNGHTAALMTTATSAYPLLNEISDPHLEQFNTWQSDKYSLEWRAEPMMCEFWGSIGDYARQYVMDPATRSIRRHLLVDGLADWRHPQVGLNLIQSFSKPQVFADGDVRCGDAFRFGLLLGLDRIYRANLQAIPARAEHIYCRFLWNRIPLMAAVDEVSLLAAAAENVKSPDEPFHFYADPKADDKADHDRYMGWLFKEFFQNSFAHLMLFKIGYEGCFAFDYQEAPFSRLEPAKEVYDRINEELHLALGLALNSLEQLKGEGGLYGDAEMLYKSLRKSLGLKGKSLGTDLPAREIVQAWPLVLEALDHVIPSVYHRHADLLPSDVDWEWLKQGVSEARQQGRMDVGVILDANGTIGTGSVFPKGFNIKLKIDDPATQVPFLDRSNGFGFMRIVSWQDLESGEAFKSKKKAKDAGKPADGTEKAPPS